jgi:hypothetical protein
MQWLNFFSVPQQGLVYWLPVKGKKVFIENLACGIIKRQFQVAVNQMKIAISLYKGKTNNISFLSEYRQNLRNHYT